MDQHAQNLPGKSLNHWIKALSDKEMPAFAHTARIITGEASRQESSASELARVILQDASMTTRLLRMANSIYYNPSRSSINTVSRAIVILGFEAVRNICLSIAIIDSLLEGTNRAHVVNEMARSFHAAVQAKTLAQHRKDRSPEEVFIATLLYHLGRMAFWCFADSVDPDAATRLDGILERSAETPADAEARVLGFSLAELTAGLNREWHLTSLLGEALEGKPGADPRTSNVILAHQLAERAEAGWDTPGVKELLKRAAESTYMPLDKVTQLIHNNAKEAAITMSNLGAGKASRLIPVPAALAAELPRGDTAPAEESKSQFLEPDADLQLRILRELSQLVIDEEPNLSLMFEMVLEGIYRGVGMDRTVLALVSPDRKGLRAKYVLGWDRQQVMQQFRFRLSQKPQHLMDYLLSNQQPLWVPRVPEEPIRNLITAEIEQVTGNAPFFVMPLGVRDKVIGVLYADRRPSRRDLCEENFTAFRLFGQQAQLGLSYLKGQR